MVRQDSGNIVNLALVDCFIPFPSTVSYVASRFAVMGLSGGLWVEGKDLAFNVSTVCPGIVSTPIFDTSPTVGFKRKDYQTYLDALQFWEQSSSDDAVARLSEYTQLVGELEEELMRILNKSES
jgi:short-subunit dehydrogenase